MSKVYVVITNYIVTGEGPSCEVFNSQQSAREYVLESIKRDVSESERYDVAPIWKDEVLKACDEAIASGCADTEYFFAVETFNDTDPHPQYEEYWVFARKAQS